MEEAGHEGSHQPGRGLIAQAPPEQAPQPDEHEGGGEERGRDQGLRIVVMPAMSRGGRRPIVMVGPRMNAVLQEPVEPEPNDFSKKLGDLKATLALHFTWYNLVRIHWTLRLR